MQVLVTFIISVVFDSQVGAKLSIVNLNGSKVLYFIVIVCVLTAWSGVADWPYSTRCVSSC